MTDEIEEARKRIREWEERNPISPADKERADALARHLSGADEIEELRDALDEAIKRNETLEAEIMSVLGQYRHVDRIAELEAEVERLRAARDGGYLRLRARAEAEAGKQEALICAEAAEAALKTARTALETISDNGGDTLTIEDAVRIAEAALVEQKP